MKDKHLEIMLEFQKILKIINQEISANRGNKYYFTIEQILIHNSPQELYSILSYVSPPYCAIYNNSYYDDILSLLDIYANKLYRYYDRILFSEQKHFDHYVSFSANEKAGKTSFYEEDVQMDLHNITNTIKLLEEAINLWYDVYQNRKIVAEFSDGEVQEFRIKEGELAHMFGVIWSSLKNNEELKKMGIVIPDYELGNDEKFEILLKIVELYDKGNILEYEENRLKRRLNENPSYKIATFNQSFSYGDSGALLPYPKVNARTKAFIDYRPLDRLSLLLDFKKGIKVIKNDPNDVKNTLLLSKNNLSDKYNWTSLVSRSYENKRHNVMTSILLKRPTEYEEYMRKLSEKDSSGDFLAKASITTRIELDSPIPSSSNGSASGSASSSDVPPGGGGSNTPGGGSNNSNNNNGPMFSSNVRVFSDEEQLSFISDVLQSFNPTNLRDIIDYYHQLIDRRRMK